MRIKRVLSMLVAMLLAISVSACASQSNGEPVKTESVNQETTKAVEKITMVFAGWSGEEESSKPIIEEMVNTWNEKEENAKVKWLGWPYSNALQQLTIRSAGGEDLDVIQVPYAWALALDKQGSLQDLTPLFDSAWVKQNIEDAAVESGKIAGSWKGMPWTLASIGMVYNPSILEKAGVTEVPKTIEELEKALEKIKAIDKNMIPYGFSTKGTTLTADFIPWLWNFGGAIMDSNGNITINSDVAVEALTVLKRFLDKGYIKMDIDRFDARTIYAQQQMGFYHDAIMARGTAESNGVAKEDLDKSIQPMLPPVFKSGMDPQSTMWGHYLAVSTNSRNAKKAAEFIQHVIGEEMSLKYFKKTGMLPVMKSAMESPEVKNDAWSTKWLEITKFAKTPETSGYTNKSELDTIISEVIQAALLGAKSPKEALDDAASRLKAAMK